MRGLAAVLGAKGVFGAEQLRRTILLGEVGLGGRLRPVRGILPATLAAQQAGFPRVIVPLRQAGEAKLVEGIEVFGIASITQLVAFLRGVPMRRDALEVSAVHSLAGFVDHHAGVCRRDERRRALSRAHRKQVSEPIETTLDKLPVA